MPNMGEDSDCIVKGSCAGRVEHHGSTQAERCGMHGQHMAFITHDDLLCCCVVLLCLLYAAAVPICVLPPIRQTLFGWQALLQPRCCCGLQVQRRAHSALGHNLQTYTWTLWVVAITRLHGAVSAAVKDLWAPALSYHLCCQVVNRSTPTKQPTAKASQYWYMNSTVGSASLCRV